MADAAGALGTAPVPVLAGVVLGAGWLAGTAGVAGVVLVPAAVLDTPDGWGAPWSVAG
ncbi:MAG TPA: hypothetical protein VE673_10860 [Pseudonocardiaceae bacterium]|nr:hypothetical protein [Pseudonocardiaceae bacterium]